MGKPKEGYIIINSKACTITARSCMQQELDCDYASLYKTALILGTVPLKAREEGYKLT